MTSGPDPSASVAGDRPFYASYVLFILFLVHVTAVLDRQLMAILIQPIQDEIGVSDTAMGLLTGFAFALFYLIAGIPIARWADRGTRRSIIALGLGLWSIMTVCVGAAQNFWQLVVFRVGVGVGEAASGAPAHSLISDYFKPEQRATALAIFGIGGTAGIMLGYLVGGWINEFFGWRMAFIVAGIPGVVLALILRLTVREPMRGRLDPGPAAMASQTPALNWWQVVRGLLSIPSYRHMVIAASLSAFAGMGANSWLPTFLIRVHGMGTGEAGTWLALLGAGFIAFGIFAGGFMADRLGRRDKRWYMWIPALGAFFLLPSALLFLWLDSLTLALVFLAPFSLCLGWWIAPCLAMGQGLVNPGNRSMSSAVIILTYSLIGIGVGPVVIGFISDILEPTVGRFSLRYALIVTSFANIWAIVHYILAARTLREDLEKKPGTTH